MALDSKEIEKNGLNKVNWMDIECILMPTPKITRYNLKKKNLHVHLLSK